MSRRSYTSILGALLLGCPQLLDDGFGPSESGTGGATGSSGATSSFGVTGAAGVTGAVGVTGAAGASGAAGGSSFGGQTGGTGAIPSPGGAGSGAGGAGGTAGETTCSPGDFSTPQVIGGLGRSGALYGPALARNGLVLAFSESIDGAPEDIFLSRRSARSEPFEVGEPALGINSAAAEGTAFVGEDALILYFFSDRDGGAGRRDIYRASRADDQSEFAAPAPAPGINGPADDHMPWVSPDELTIYFASTRAADEGGSNIWYAQRSGAGDGFQPPLEVPGLNSSDRDASPSLSADQLLLFFCSDREGGAGSDDIWMAKRENAASDFEAPEPVPNLNGPASEVNVALSGDGREVIFSSSRDGNRKLYRSVRTCL